MWVRVLLVAAFAFLVGYAIRDIVRANPQLFGGARRGRRPPPRPIHPPTPAEEDVRRGQVLVVRRKPHEVLGVSADATVEEARAAWQAERARNDPSRLEGMSDDLLAMAEVRVAELDAAWAAFQEGR